MADSPIRRGMNVRGNVATDDLGIIRSQMRLAAGLIAFGPVVIVLFQLAGVLDGPSATAAFGLATAVVGAGAAMLPTGAAAGASARILRSGQDDGSGGVLDLDPGAGKQDTRVNGGKPDGSARTSKPNRGSV